MEEIEKVKRLDRCESGFKYIDPLILLTPMNYFLYQFPTIEYSYYNCVSCENENIDWIAR